MHELLSGWQFVSARALANWRLLVVAAAGVVAAATLLAAAPIYAQSMADLGLQFRLDRALSDTSVDSYTVEALRPAHSADSARRDSLWTVFDQRLGWLGELVSQDRSGRLTLAIERPDGDMPSEADWATFVYALAALEDTTEVVEGRLPEADATVPEVVLPDGFQRHVAVGNRLHARLGGFDDCLRPPASEVDEEREAEVPCVPTTRVAQSAVVTVTGFVRQRDTEDPRWQVFSGSFTAPDEPLFVSLDGLPVGDIARAMRGEGSMPLLTTPEQLRGALGQAMSLTAFQYRVGVVVDPTALRTEEVERALNEASALQADVTERLGLTASPSFNAIRTLEQFRNSLTFNQVPLLLILLQVVGIVVYYVVIVSSMLVERQAEEIAVFRSRGASTTQLVGLYLLEAAAIAVPAAIVAPWLASLGVSALGYTPTFEPITNGRALPVEVSPLAYVLAVGGALLALAAMLLPAFVAAQRGIVDVKAQQARPPRRSVIQRYYLDFAAVALAGFLLWQLDRRGSVFDPDSVGGWSTDPLLLLSPFVFTLAVAAVLIRLYPPLLRWTVALLLAARGTAVAVGLRRAARSPAAYARLMLLLVMAVSVGTFAASYGPTVELSQADRIRYETGSGFRGQLATRAGVSVADAAAKTRAIEGVRDVALAYRGTVTTVNGAAVPVLGIDAERASSMLWFREDFAGEPLGTLSRRLVSAVPSIAGIELPVDATAVAVNVSGSPGRARSVLWARIRDANGRYFNARLGRLDFDGWLALEVSLPADATAPAVLTGFLITDDQAAGVRQAGSLYFDDVEVVREGGDRILLDDFEGQFTWSMFAPVRSAESMDLSDEQAASGRRAMRWSWGLGITEGRRLLAVNAANVPLAAVVSPGVAQLHGLEVGGLFAVQIEGQVVPVAVRAIAEYFPTLDPTLGYVIVNREHLEALALLLDAPAESRANEVWVDFTGPLEEQRQIVEQFSAAGSPLDLTGPRSHRDERLAAVEADPTLRAGGSGILTASFVAVLALSTLGFIVTLVLGARGRTLEFAVLRAVGSTRAQILRSLVLEWGVVLVLGAAIGVLLGRRIARVMLSFLDVTEDGGRVLPPFMVSTDWVALAVGGLVLLVATGLALGLAWGATMRRADARELRYTR